MLQQKGPVKMSIENNLLKLLIRSVVQHGSPWAKIKASTGIHFFLGLMLPFPHLQSWQW